MINENEEDTEELLGTFEHRPDVRLPPPGSRWKKYVLPIVSLSLLIISVILLCGVLGLGIQVKKQLDNWTGTSNENPKTPSSGQFPKDWIQLGKDAVSMIDFSADPCNDFYQYSCGGWISKTLLPPDVSMLVPVFQDTGASNLKILQKISEAGWPLTSDFFSSCTGDEQRITVGLERVVNATASLIFSVSSSNDPNFWVVLAKLHARGVDAFFYPETLENIFQDNSLIYLVLNEGGITGSPQQYKNQQFLQTLQQMIVGSLILSPSSGLTENDITQALAIANNIINLESRLATFWDNSANFIDLLQYPTYQQFQSTSGLNLSSYFTGLRIPALGSTDTIGLIGAAYFNSQAFPSLLVSTPTSTLQYYLLWRVLFSYLQLGITPFQVPPTLLSLKHPLELFRSIPSDQLAINPLQKLKPQRMPLLKLDPMESKTGDWSPQENLCLEFMNMYLGDFIGHLFSEDILTDELIADIRDLTAGIKNGFRAGLDVLDWIDAVSKQATIYKLENIIQLIGHPNALSNYRGVVLDPTADGFGDNLQFLTIFNFQRKLAEIGTLYDRLNYQFDATVVNAFYMPLTNTINFPAGILESPMYSIRLPALFRHARLGYVVGHEITHGFDNSGRHWNAFGTYKDFMDEQSIRAFVEKTQCVVNQYSSYEVVPGFYINGTKTLGENIADLGGVKNAWRSYQAYRQQNGDEFEGYSLSDKLSNDQLFWVILAQTWCTKATDQALIRQISTDVHSPSKFRVNGPLSNTEEFGSAFNCPVGSPMNPTKKCRVW